MKKILTLVAVFVCIGCGNDDEKLDREKVRDRFYDATGKGYIQMGKGNVDSAFYFSGMKDAYYIILHGENYAIELDSNWRILNGTMYFKDSTIIVR